MLENHFSPFEKRPEPDFVKSATTRDQVTEISLHKLIGALQADGSFFSDAELEAARQIAILEHAPESSGTEADTQPVADATEVPPVTPAKVANTAIAELFTDGAPEVNTAFLDDVAADVSADASSQAPVGENWKDVTQDDVELAA